MRILQRENETLQTLVGLDSHSIGVKLPKVSVTAAVKLASVEALAAAAP
jgi:hypothetical protein